MMDQQKKKTPTAKERVLKHSLISIICSEAKPERYNKYTKKTNQLKFQIAVLLIKLFKLYLFVAVKDM